jgi:hypothetical protein
MTKISNYQNIRPFLMRDGKEVFGHWRIRILELFRISDFVLRI